MAASKKPSVAILCGTLLFGFILCGPECALAVTLQLSHQYGEFVDHGKVSAYISTSENSRLDCKAPVAIERSGDTITLTAHKIPGDSHDDPPCSYETMAVLGPLQAGDYAVVAKLVSVDGLSAETQNKTMRILPLFGRCNADPLARVELTFLHASLTPQMVAQRIATDSAYAAKLGNPISAGFLFEIGGYNYGFLNYRQLDDITVKMAHLDESGEFSYVGRDRRFCVSPPPADDIAEVVEFYHPTLDHFFYTADPAEIRAVEAGAAGAEWVRTSKSFRAIANAGCPFENATPVYRFYGVPGVGPNSHFLTRDRAECYVVDQTHQWRYEGVAFWANPVDQNLKCAIAGSTLYRLWRPFGDSNHRYTTDIAVVAEMVARGWVNEGPVMCL